MDGQISFQDFFKKKFWESFSLATGELTFFRIVVTMLLAFGVGCWIYLLYKKTYKGVMYNRGFNISLVITTLISSLIIMTISSNLILSLGMVGALSIVRFRTALKDPLDIVFMFWSITAGIVLGAGVDFYWAGIIGSLIIGGILLLFNLKRVKSRNPYLLILRYDMQCETEVDKMVGRLPPHVIKSKTVSKSGIESTIEIRLKEEDTAFLRDFIDIKGVQDASLISHNDDF